MPTSLPARAGALHTGSGERTRVAAFDGMPTVTRNLVPTAQPRPEITTSAEEFGEETYLALIIMPDNDAVEDRSRSPLRDLSRLEGTVMLNPQLSPHRSAANRPVRSAWTQTSNHTSLGTPDLLSQMRRIPPAYLGLAGLVLLVVGLMAHAGWLVVGIGVALMIAAGVTSATRPRTRVMYWRGRRIELTEESSTRSQARRWLGRR
jgi:hypothetical protein